MSAPSPTPPKRVSKPSAKASDPDNVARVGSKKKASTVKGGKSSKKNSIPQLSAVDLQKILAQVAAAGGLDAALNAGASQASAALTTGQKCKGYNLPGPSSKKKAKKSVVLFDDEEGACDEDDEALDNVLGAAVRIVDDDKADGNDSDDEEEELGKATPSGSESEEEDAQDEGAVVQPGPTVDGEPSIAELEDLSTAWEAMKADIRTTNRIESADLSQATSSFPVTPPPATLSRATSIPSCALLCLDCNSKPLHKLSLNHFTPRTQRVLNATRPEIHKSTAIEHVFPSIEKYTWVRGLAELAVSHFADRNEAMVATIARIFGNPNLRDLFTQYCMYARSGLLSTTTTKTCSSIAGHYGIPGTLSPKDITKRVTWLVEQGNFKMGSLNVTDETCNRQEPYQNEIYATLICMIFFSKGRADAAVFKALTETQSIPGPVFALLSTAIEHALFGTVDPRGEVNSGKLLKTGKFLRLEHPMFPHHIFRYQFHLQAWKVLEEEAPTYTTNLSKCLFRTAAEQTSKMFLLEGAMDELEGIDMRGLEAMAKAEEDLAASSSATTAVTAPAFAGPDAAPTTPVPGSASGVAEGIVAGPSSAPAPAAEA
ncbi:hypothetical protein PM082_023213 [Marasmius tenuissimus]|nr:hypothetical protein PM082_023213 [Marasmius tenuissimus]